MVNSCMFAGVCRVRFLLPYGTLDRLKVWAEDDKDAARSVCLLRFSFVLLKEITSTVSEKELSKGFCRTRKCVDCFLYFSQYFAVDYASRALCAFPSLHFLLRGSLLITVYLSRVTFYPLF